MDRAEILREMIAEKQKQIELYQAMIAEWERELGGSFRATQPSPATDSTAKKKALSAEGPLSLIQGLVFYGKSQPEAAKAFLEMVGYPLTTEQILEGIEKGGVKVGGKTPTAKKQNFYTILDRSPEFARVAKGTWGLVGWPGVTKNDSRQESETKKSNEKETASE